MLDHMILTVSNVKRSLAFYEEALKPLGIKFFVPYKGEGDHPDFWGFGDGKRAFFWIKQGKSDPASIHWGFMAENNAKPSGLQPERVRRCAALASKNEPKPELNLPLWRRRIRGCAERRIPQRRVRRTKSSVVGEIEELRAEL